MAKSRFKGVKPSRLSRRKFFRQSHLKPTRDLSLSLRRSLAAGFKHSEKINFNDVTKPILRKLPLKLHSRDIDTRFSDFQWHFFFKRPSTDNHCVRRRQRREVLFARGLGGSIKVRFARWRSTSFVSCKG